MLEICFLNRNTNAVSPKSENRGYEKGIYVSRSSMLQRTSTRHTKLELINYVQTQVKEAFIEQLGIL